MARTEVRKECPSCGLGVPIDEKVCEFCGWNFDAEDEWTIQIDKLEQELITEKQKFDDTSVDRMIKSTLRKPEEKEGEVGTETVLSTQVVKMKKIMQKPPKQMATPPAVNESTVATVTVTKERVPAPSGPVVSKPKSFRIDVANIAAPKVLDLDLNIEEPKSTQEPKEGPIAAAEKPAEAEPPTQIKPEIVSPTTPAKREKVVRRVVSHSGQPKPMMAQGEARIAVPAKAAASTAPQQMAAPERPKPPVTAAKPVTIPERDERKSRFGGFGKMFSDKKDEKAHHSPPEKLHQTQSKEPVKPTIKVFICPLCNKEVLDTEKKCPNCGAEFE